LCVGRAAPSHHRRGRSHRASRARRLRSGDWGRAGARSRWGYAGRRWNHTGRGWNDAERWRDHDGGRGRKQHRGNERPGRRWNRYLLPDGVPGLHSVLEQPLRDSVLHRRRQVRLPGRLHDDLHVTERGRQRPETLRGRCSTPLRSRALP
jgi:hypothetical protein